MTSTELEQELRGALGSARDNFRDVAADEIFNDDEVMEEALLIHHLNYIVDNFKDLKPYLSE